ncbi:unnamed protein product [Polarella glacialis]|uniref:Bifunctional lysine-specific demethylase and histidyl-hydroxylase n=1 Tax=Polarella glacialis TaxID=89957 RepID=A0A813EXP3_POLGL|nr:unnamed protein product [Polarella glacialis]
MARYEGRLEEAYLDGCTIVCPLLSASWGPLAASVAALQEDFEGVAFSADLYLTPRGASGFRLHNDAQPSFILQVAGMKRWEVYNSSFPRPVREQTKAGDEAEALKMGPVFAGELEPGDVLHIPHGFLHRAWTNLEGPSLHVSISPLTLPSVADILEQVVKGTPKDDIPDNARQFWDQVLEQAAKGEAAKAEGEWMRRSMPFAGRQGPMHRLANKRALPIFQAWVKKWREQLRIPLAGMLQVGKHEESFDLAFDTLLDDSAGALKKAFKGINKSFQISSQVCASAAQEFPRRRAAASEGLALLNLEGPHSQVSSVTPENWPFRPSLKLDKILEQMRQAGSWSSLQELLPTGSTPDDHVELSALMAALRRRLVIVPSLSDQAGEPVASLQAGHWCSRFCDYVERVMLASAELQSKADRYPGAAGESPLAPLAASTSSRSARLWPLPALGFLFRARISEEAPAVPAEDDPDQRSGVRRAAGGGAESLVEVDLEDSPEVDDLMVPGLSAALPMAVPQLIEVSGSCAKAGRPALSPRSGLLKRKDGDHLGINGIYSLRPEPHNRAPCWVKCDEDGGACADDELRVLFRAADASSWVIDESAHAAGPEDLVAARLKTTSADPTQSLGMWAPLPSLSVRPVLAGDP